MNVKPQLAKSHKDCTANVWEKPKWCSKKLDGVRCMMKYDSELKIIKTISRGGDNYDVSLSHIIENEELLNLFNDYPDIILDGEIYVHGWPLQRISGTARLKTHNDRCDLLEYWIYDIGDDKKSFSQRLDFLNMELPDYFSENSKIKIVEHKLLKGYFEIKKYHDLWVSEGFEGLVARNPDKNYSFGKRNSDWIKFKEYKSDEFEITGISEGLRDEDMCFTLIAKNGKTFKAKPVGDRELKAEYLKNYTNYIGMMGTVNYFSLSEDGVPMQPTFKSIRPDGE